VARGSKACDNRDAGTAPDAGRDAESSTTSGLVGGDVVGASSGGSIAVNSDETILVGNDRNDDSNHCSGAELL
jgi:hypothetical protein